MHEPRAVLSADSRRLLRSCCGPDTHREVALVADEHDGHVGVGVLAGVLQPARQVVECLPPAAQTCKTLNIR